MSIIDNQDELFDIVDENDRVTGQATRREVHSDKSLIHRSIGIVIFNIKGEVFLQQRSAGKDTDPLKWTISASGHVLSGDSYDQTARRELMEELGVNLELRPFSKHLCRTPQETEMQMLYKAYFDGPFKLNKQEIVKGKFFSRNELKEAVRSGIVEISHSGRVALEKLGWII